MNEPSVSNLSAIPIREAEHAAVTENGSVPGGFAVWDAENAAENAAWTSLWNRSPARDVFAHPNYGRLFCKPGDRALCAACEGEAGNVLFPFILRDLSREPYWETGLGAACDLVSPYGYGGAAFWDTADPARLAQQFCKSFDVWASAHAVVSQFVRFSPFAEGLLPYSGVVCENRKVIVCDLQSAPHVIWREFEHTVRYNIRRAQRAGVQVRVDTQGDSLAEFLTIYEHTMRRRGADSAFFFPRQFFERLQRDLCGQFAYYHAVHRGRVLSSELVLVSANAVYSYLGGTDREAFSLSPNHLLKFEIIRTAAAQGKRWFVLGGGYEPNDGIFQYKRGFAPGGATPFRVGWKVYDETRCQRLVEAHRRHAERSGQCWSPRPNYFPPYRA